MEEDNGFVHEKWIASLIWLGLLAGLVFTSFHLAEVSITLNLPQLQSNLFTLPGGTEESDPNKITTLNYLNTGVYGFGGLILAMAWWRFAGLSHQLLVAFATDSSPFGILLYLPTSYLAERQEAKSEEPLDLTQSHTSDLAIVVRYLGVAWAIFILGAILIPFIAKVLE